MIISIISVILIVVLGGGFVYDIYKQPNLTYKELNPYKYSENESVTGVILKNSGRSTAHEIRMELELESSFKNITVESPESYQMDEKLKEIVMTFPRITSGVDVTIYCSVPSTNPNLNVSVTSEEGKGIPESESEDTSLALALALAGISATLGIILSKIMKFMVQQD